MRKPGDDAPMPVEPMMGSILPLKSARSGWYLPDKDKRHRQDVWSGSDLCNDLAAVLQRRYIDSLKHERPALMAVHGARLDDVLAFLNCELDDMRIARWTEAMSLIDWRFIKSEETIEDEAREVADYKQEDEDLSSIPPVYAALRMLLEIECEWQGKEKNQWKKRRSQQPFTLLCQRSPSSLPVAVSEALRWLSIWGVRNPWGAKARAEKSRIAGRYVVSLPHAQLAMDGETGRHLAARLAAAVCIPLAWQDRWQLARVITLPPGT
jgi:CRISPR-associated protein Csx17